MGKACRQKLIATLQQQAYILALTLPVTFNDSLCSLICMRGITSKVHLELRLELAGVNCHMSAHCTTVNMPIISPRIWPAADATCQHTAQL